MTHFAGSAVYVSFQGVPITADERSLDVSESLDVADTTAGADTSRSHVPTVDSCDFSLEHLYNGTAGTAILAALAIREAGTFTFGPNGTASGQPKFECQATVTGFNMSIPYADAISLSSTLVRNGPWTANYASLGSTY